METPSLSIADSFSSTASAACKRAGISYSQTDSFRVAIIGADGLMEAKSLEASIAFFSGFCKYVVDEAALGGAVEGDVMLDFYGPSVPEFLTGNTQCRKVTSTGGGTCLSFHYTFFRGFFHDWSSVAATQCHKPTICLLYNPGCWGYPSWLPTISAILKTGTPCVITSYNIFEAEDDYDTIESVGNFNENGNARWLWSYELNPHASTSSRPAGVASDPDRRCTVNAIWQCFQGLN